MIGSLLAIFIFSMISIASMLLLLHIVMAMRSRSGEVTLIVAILTGLLAPAYFWTKWMPHIEAFHDFFVITGVGLLLTAVAVWLIDVFDRVTRRRNSSAD